MKDLIYYALFACILFFSLGTIFLHEQGELLGVFSAGVEDLVVAFAYLNVGIVVTALVAVVVAVWFDAQ